MVNDVKKRIIEKIRHNRISTEEIADIMGKKGLFENAFPVNRGHFAVGNINGFMLIMNQTGVFMSRQETLREAILY